MPRKIHRLAIVLALLAAVALLVPSGATSFLLSEPADPVGNYVELQPAQGPDGDYAYIDDGELVIDVDGVNPGEVTRIDEVFIVHYNGSQHAEVWFTHEGTDLTFVSEERAVESSDEAIALGPNESAVVGLVVDTTDGDAVENVEEFTVHSQAPEPTDGGSDDPSSRDSSGSSSDEVIQISDGDDEETPTETPTTPTDPPEPGPAGSSGDGATATGGDGVTTTISPPLTTVAPGEFTLTSVLLGERAGAMPGRVLGMGLLILLAALMVFLARRYTED